ncbi:MAG: ABC transporter substrate-binding protein [Gammaproteobacteria bacterium]|nr:ABC transporter substrate-binding protein [Gammaproteobacteria bacterium]
MASFRLVMAAILLMTALLAQASVRAADDVSPHELVRSTISRMLTAMHEEQAAIKQNPDHLFELVSSIVLPYFDFERMSMWALGKNWRRATPEQRVRFVEQFHTLLVHTYGSALSEYSDEEIIYLPYVDDGKAGRVTVRTEIEQAGSTIPISYSLYQSRDGWKVYDVAISGVSLVTNYRSTFGTIIREKGMDSLIQQLSDRNNDLTDG